MVKTLRFGSEPRPGERILVLRREKLELILRGRKKLEIRGTRLREGDVWLGCSSMIAGKACIGPALAISTEREWASLRPEHLVLDATLPYKTTFGLPLRSVTRLRRGISYVHPRGAIGIVKFRREAINSSYQKNGHFVFCHVCVRDHVHDALQMDCA